MFFIAILKAQDGRIIVYGGENPALTPALDPLLVLDTTEQVFRWSIPVVKYTPRFMPYRAHTATLVGNYMIVAFGTVLLIEILKLKLNRKNKIKQKNFFYTGLVRYDTNNFLSDKIHMLDISDKNDYRWVTSFIPNTTASVPTNVPPTTCPCAIYTIVAIVEAIFGFLLGIVIIIAVIMIFLYKRNMRDYVRIPD